MTRLRVLISASGVAAAFVSGCGIRSSTPLPNTASAIAQAAAARGDSTPLLYILDGLESRKLSVYSLPSGKPKKIVRMPGYGDGYNICSDGSGHIFVPADDVVFEYKHGGKTPIAEVIDNFRPYSCASDPKTGELAVVNEDQKVKSKSACTISFYKPPRGKVDVRYDAQFNYCRYPTYDSAGNLFISGSTGSKSDLVELPAGRDKFVTIALNEPIGDSDAIQWDGKDIAIENDGGGSSDRRIIVDRVQVSGTKGTIVAKIRFRSWPSVYVPFWIEGDELVAPEANYHTIGIWRYPQGGLPRQSFSVTASPYALTISAPP